MFSAKQSSCRSDCCWPREFDENSPRDVQTCFSSTRRTRHWGIQGALAWFIILTRRDIRNTCSALGWFCESFIPPAQSSAVCGPWAGRRDNEGARAHFSPCPFQCSFSCRLSFWRIRPDRFCSHGARVASWRDHPGTADDGGDGASVAETAPPSSPWKYMKHCHIRNTYIL